MQMNKPFYCCELFSSCLLFSLFSRIFIKLNFAAIDILFIYSFQEVLFSDFVFEFISSVMVSNLSQRTGIKVFNSRFKPTAELHRKKKAKNSEKQHKK